MKIIFDAYQNLIYKNNFAKKTQYPITENAYKDFTELNNNKSDIVIVGENQQSHVENKNEVNADFIPFENNEILDFKYENDKNLQLSGIKIKINLAENKENCKKEEKIIKIAYFDNLKENNSKFKHNTNSYSKFFKKKTEPNNKNSNQHENSAKTLKIYENIESIKELDFKNPYDYLKFLLQDTIFNNLWESLISVEFGMNLPSQNTPIIHKKSTDIIVKSPKIKPNSISVIHSPIKVLPQVKPPANYQFAKRTNTRTAEPTISLQITGNQCKIQNDFIKSKVVSKPDLWNAKLPQIKDANSRIYNNYLKNTRLNTMRKKTANNGYRIGISGILHLGQITIHHKNIKNQHPYYGNNYKNKAVTGIGNAYSIQ